MTLFCTDGLTEFFHGDKELGTQRLLRRFMQNAARECGALLRRLSRHFREFPNESAARVAFGE